MRKFLKTDGSPSQDGITVTTDHVVTTFTLDIRSLSTISVDTVKRILQNHFEVMTIQKVNEIIYVK